MVKSITKNNKTYYVCNECGFLYKNKNIAAKCEDWCNKYHSCNIEITKHSINV